MLGMKQIRLGRSDLQVSRIAFGTWQLGGDWGATDEKAAINAIRRAADGGINFFDTAQGYGSAHPNGCWPPRLKACRASE